MAGEIQHLFEGFGAHIQHEGDARGHAFEIPDVRHGRGEFDVPHPVAADLGFGYFHAALVADHALIADAFILAAVAFPVLRRPEDPFAEQPADFRFLRSVIDGFRLGNFAVGPFADLFRGRYADLYRIEIVKFKHLRTLPLFFIVLVVEQRVIVELVVEVVAEIVGNGGIKRLVVLFEKFFGIEFEFSSVLAISVLFAINAVQAIGDMSATTIGGMDREPDGDELRGGIIGFGVSNMFSALFGGLPNATYSQNVGIVSSTKVVNRKVLALTAVMLLFAGLVPKFSALLTTIPQCVLGGATVSVFASIAMTGMKLVAMQPMSYRNTSIVGLSAALGMGVSLVSESLSRFPSWVTMVFASSPVVLATIVAIIMNLILPKEEGTKGN